MSYCKLFGTKVCTLPAARRNELSQTPFLGELQGDPSAIQRARNFVVFFLHIRADKGGSCLAARPTDEHLFVV